MDKLSAKKINKIVILIFIFLALFMFIAYYLSYNLFTENDLQTNELIENLLEENKNKQNSNIIIEENATNNQEPTLPSEDGEENNGGESVVVGEFNNFYDLFNYALNNYKTCKNMYSVASGEVIVNGKYGIIGISNVKGKISMSKARNVNNKKYFEYYIKSLDSVYDFSLYMQAYADRNTYKEYYPETGWNMISKDEFIKTYKSDMDFWFYNINSNNSKIKSFEYDKYIKQYSATIEVFGDALNDYSYQIYKFLELTELAKFNSCEITFTFNQNAQFLNVIVKENFNIKSSISKIDCVIDSTYVETFKVLGDTFLNINDPSK